MSQFVLKHFTEERLISRFHTHPWPPRSPDLSPVDFWYWGNLKRLVYATGVPSSKAELIQIVEECSRLISVEDVSRANDSFLDRLALVINEEGRHFEHLI